MSFIVPAVLRATGRTWAGRIAVVAIAAMIVAGCDISGLPIGTQCTPQTCDYVVNTLLAVPGASGATLLADSNNAFYQFDGSKWQKVGAETATLRGPLFASPAFAQDQTLFLGNTASSDGGKTWQAICAVVTAISPGFAQDKTLFGVNAVVTAGGTASTPTPSSGTQTTPTGPQGCPSSDGSYFISTDGGQSWKAQTGPQGASRPDLFVLSPKYSQDQTIFATFSVTQNQQPSPSLYRSTDGGQSWTKVLAGKQNVLAVSTSFASDKTVVAISADKAQVSTDAGRTWNALKLPIATTQAAEVTFSPNYASDKTMLLASAAADTNKSQAGTYISTDRGATWNRTGPAAQRGQNFPAIIFSPSYASDKTIYASSLDQGMGPAKSTDLGANWAAIADGLDLVAGLGG